MRKFQRETRLNGTSVSIEGQRIWIGVEVGIQSDTRALLLSSGKEKNDILGHVRLAVESETDRQCVCDA